MDEKEKVALWIEERELISRIGQPWRGILGITLSFSFFLCLWYVFMDTQGILRWYTPLYGFMYISVVLGTLIWQCYVTDFWPLKTEWLAQTHPLMKGISLLAINFAIVAFLIWGVCYNFMGVLALPYLSAPVLESLGINTFVAREYSSQAILMWSSIISFVTSIWMICFRGFPWQGISKPARIFSNAAIIGFLSLVAILIGIHPHFHVLFYPWQKYVAAYPWWFQMASTLSANFVLGYIMCITVAAWLFETIWESYPYKLLKNQLLRGLAGIGCIVLVGSLLFHSFLYLQSVAWGAPVPGATRLLAPDWRYVHAGELAAMLLIAATIIDSYFDKWPRNYSLEVNIFLRTVMTCLGGAVFHGLYYKFGPALLGIQAGYSHPSQFTLAPLILLLISMLTHNWFMDNWPLKKINRVVVNNQATSSIKNDSFKAS